MRFIEVKARTKDAPRAGVISSFIFLLNVDLIGAFDKDTVLLKGSKTVLLNGQEYTDITVINKSDIQKL